MSERAKSTPKAMPLKEAVDAKGRTIGAALGLVAAGELPVACLFARVRDACSWWPEVGKGWIPDAKHRRPGGSVAFPEGIEFAHVNALRDDCDWRLLVSAETAVTAISFSAIVRVPFPWGDGDVGAGNRLLGRGKVTLALGDLWVMSEDLPKLAPVESAWAVGRVDPTHGRSALVELGKAQAALEDAARERDAERRRAEVAERDRDDAQKREHAARELADALASATDARWEYWPALARARVLFESEPKTFKHAKDGKANFQGLAKRLQSEGLATLISLGTLRDLLRDNWNRSPA